ncbi:transmembrane protein, putative (macronuclear) [Tetrahymena thermophila SB210]|uniref:Transmembrane protein, putative n=1 Tax=Tetrahymena thermophila (strain SB210) TaxID=312017 RepID=W7XA58_TETTS|nr:transmembrane protein, putative [Tetrahymena thermophila SB210]EWS74217.1 transmembrane protein, putative [Tetrahymena thermophila SB210]|eukprot:XP_012653245.1 transmembrane protein, putative [Tetrahymena thermophila SB210]
MNASTLKFPSLILIHSYINYIQYYITLLNILFLIVQTNNFCKQIFLQYRLIGQWFRFQNFYQVCQQKESSSIYFVADSFYLLDKKNQQKIINFSQNVLIYCLAVFFCRIYQHKSTQKLNIILCFNIIIVDLINTTFQISLILLDIYTIYTIYETNQIKYLFLNILQSKNIIKFQFIYLFIYCFIFVNLKNQIFSKIQINLFFYFQVYELMVVIFQDCFQMTLLNVIKDFFNL